MKNEFTAGDIELLFAALRAYEREAAGDTIGKVMIERMTNPHISIDALSAKIADEAQRKVGRREEETIFLKGKLLRLKNYVAEHPEEATTKGDHEE